MKSTLLKARADQFRKALEQHSEDDDVRDFLERFMPLYLTIEGGGKISPPYPKYALGAYFTNPDLSPLAERYGFGNADNPLFNAASDFMSAIMGWDESGMSAE